MADSTADDCNVQDKGHIDEKTDRKENEEKTVKTDVTKANTKRSNKRVNVDDVMSRLDFKATGVRPSDLAKHDQPFFIHSENPDSYVKFKTSKADLGHVETSKNWATGNGLFALEDAGSGKYYIKAISGAKAVVGYLYLSDKKTGVFSSKANNILWSKEKQDQPNYKFEFQESDWQNSNHRIVCNGRFLLATASEKGYLKTKEGGLAVNEGYFELNMPPEIDVEITEGEQFDRTNVRNGRHRIDRKICNNATDEEMEINHDVIAEMDRSNIKGLSAQTTDVDSQTMKRTLSMTVPPKRKGVSRNITTIVKDIIEEELHIKIKGTGKEFVGYKIRVDEPGTMELIQQLKPLEKDETFSQDKIFVS